MSTSAADLLEDSGLADLKDVDIVPNPISPSKLVERSPTSQITVAYLGGPGLHKGYLLVPKVVELLRPENIRWQIVAGPLAHSTDDADQVTAVLKELRGPDVQLLDGCSRWRISTPPRASSSALPIARLAASWPPKAWPTASRWSQPTYPRSGSWLAKTRQGSSFLRVTLRLPQMR